MQLSSNNCHQVKSTIGRERFLCQYRPTQTTHAFIVLPHRRFRLRLLPRQTSRRWSRLVCRYHDNGRHPKFVIGPVKQEEEWDRPRIIRYHDIVSEKEMEKVKELAKPRVRPCSCRLLAKYQWTCFNGACSVSDHHSTILSP